ncbi:orotidine-5'-phosphate decarboxylase [Campylobacter volucris]|uniref:orotidine-5'-phosphate decarboxylase n=1 Tax=Campylobacter volucris TaxID=1031542 RepID=UPI0018A050EE|nr:orotidine-5'-phosphate decarboxylase [Campylobacter volucris]MBF7048055.1 orotidine-5'-phosphate decarboxylase [Campylobacter volucris]
MKLCVAFDLSSFDECVNLAKELKGLDLWVKIGLRSYLRDGVRLLEEIKKIDDFKFFLDLKLYDIPNTMADACEELARLDVDMINIHASAGQRAMMSIMERLSKLSKRPLVLAVSALTSFDESEFITLYNQDIKNAVCNFSKISYESGLDGMVCSVYESLLIKENTCKNFITLTPGIRPFKEDSDDQKRVANLQCAKENLSDFIVVGRPIYKAQDPRKICEDILASI